MDPNGQRFWMLAREADWAIDPVERGLEYDASSGHLRLRSERRLDPLPGADSAAARTLANLRLGQVPQVLDEFGTRAYWEAALSSIVAVSDGRDPIAIWSAALGDAPSDAAIGRDGVLYVALDGGVTLQDRRERWDAVVLVLDNFSAFRLAAAPDQGVWVLDRTNRAVARVAGLPLRARPFELIAPNAFRACEENHHPPAIRRVTPTDWLPASEDPVAIACSKSGNVAVLTWATDGPARLRVFDPDGQPGTTLTLDGAHFPYSLAWVGDDRVAVLQTAPAAEATAYPIAAIDSLVEPVGEIYPLRNHDGSPFAHAPSGPPRYRSTTGETIGLYPLSLPSYTSSGVAANTQLLDSGNSGTTWHRAYLEAVIPPACGVRLFLAATDTPEPPGGEDVWYEHRFGRRYADGAGDVPCGAWLDSASELPFDNGLLGCPSEVDHIGLFTVLVQRSTRTVRALRGRYLWARVQLEGDSLRTPELAALRVYASRFSYVEHYLPELYREQLFGPDADALATRSTPADFLERFLDNFEGVLTPLEDRIGSAYLLTDPRATPEPALDWLASWIGLTFDPHYPADRRRALLESTPRLYQQRGTLDGLRLALDTVTAGACERGSIVVVEDFRVRRTVATILGANLTNAEDPLLAGLSESGNSYVGDTLFLGDEQREEFLAVFGPETSQRADERAAVAALFDRLAYRVTVLVHHDTPSIEFSLVRRIVELETPAHVEARVIAASDALLIGVASLVAVDTYPGPQPVPAPVEVGRSLLGYRDLVLGVPSLDPRLESGGTQAPVRAWRRPHALAGNVTAPFGAGFTLDASESSAAVGRRIVDYVWRFVTPTP